MRRLYSEYCQAGQAWWSSLSWWGASYRTYGTYRAYENLRGKESNLFIRNCTITIGKPLPLALLFDSCLWISECWESKLLENRTRAWSVARLRQMKG